MKLSVREFRETGRDQVDARVASATRRRATRHCVEKDAVVRNVFGARAVGRVSDISRHGCQVELGSGHLRVGQFVSLSIGKLDPWIGMVRWGDLNVFGIEFAASLNEQVVDQLSGINARVELT